METFLPNALGIQISSATDAAYLDCTSLTPDALLTYCQTQLSSIDDQIDAFMNKQKSMMKKKELLQELKTALEGNNTCNKAAGPTETNKQNIANAYLETYNKLMKEGFEGEANMVNEQFQKWFPNGDLSTGKTNTSGNIVPTESDSEFQEQVGKVADLIDSLGKDMELNMIRLQSDMSKRQTVIQLTTQIMDKYHRGLDQIASNIK